MKESYDSRADPCTRLVLEEESECDEDDRRCGGNSRSQGEKKALGCDRGFESDVYSVGYMNREFGLKKSDAQECMYQSHYTNVTYYKD